MAHAILQKITETTIAYLKAKARAGVHAVQLFDSWGGLLELKIIMSFPWPYLEQIINALERNSHHCIWQRVLVCPERYGQKGASAVGIDWTVTADEARKRVGNKVIHNLDPAFLMASEKSDKRKSP